MDDFDGVKRSVILSSDGNHAYVTGEGYNAVSWFTRDALTGALTYGSGVGCQLYFDRGRSWQNHYGDRQLYRRRFLRAQRQFGRNGFRPTRIRPEPAQPHRRSQFYREPGNDLGGAGDLHHGKSVERTGSSLG